jgi:hypothetical protein
MASVDRDTINGVAQTTGVLAVPRGRELFELEIVFTQDAFPAFANSFPIGKQTLDAAYGRALNAGRGVVGEGGDTGPGVVGIAGGAINKNPAAPDAPRDLVRGPFPGRGVRAGVIGFGQGMIDPEVGGRVPKPGNAFGVVGVSDSTVGVWGLSAAHAGVYGFSTVTGVIGDGRSGQTGVEGVGSAWGVYGHVDYAKPNADGAGVFGAAASNLDGTFTGRAGLFVGPVDVVGDLTVTGNVVVWGTKSAAARHDDGTHRLLYCLESPESQFEDFGEAKLVKGKAEVRLDRDFIGLADTRKYHVFLTPYGESKGLFVAARRGTGFQVREQGGGKSSLSFSYRVVAKRKHVAAKRFQKVRAPTKAKLPPKLVAPEIDFDAKPAARRRATAAKKKA